MDGSSGKDESHSQRPHERLQVWMDAMRLVEEIYRFSSQFPGQEQFGLTSQLRRSAISIPSNIAEGAARRSTQEYLRFLSIARGSVSELDTQCQIAVRLGHAEQTSLPSELLNRVFASLNALINALERNKARR